MTERPSLQAVMRRCLDDYARAQPLDARQRQVCRHVLDCRTAALGGLQLGCDQCGDPATLYYACRDRHCPRCQRQASARWSKRQRAAVLPVTYHHLVFTLPHTLNGWMAVHPRVLYALLFEAVWSTLGAFGARRLGGQMGMVAVLHTWGQNLGRHVHLHCLVPGGALGDDGGWHAARGAYLFPVRALSRRFRGAFVSRLRARIDAGELPRLTNSVQVKVVLDQLMQTEWVVYTKACLEHTETVVEYLARYSHRIALADHRLGPVDAHGRVALQYTDYRDRGRHKVIMLDGAELISRFLLHVLPKGFMRIRHYGFLANRCRRQRQAQIREAIAGRAEALDAQPAEQDGTATPFDGYPCPQCQQGRLRVIGALAPRRLDGG